MPSYLPVLSYSSSPQDENPLEFTPEVHKPSSIGIEKCTSPTESVEDRIVRSPVNKSGDVVSKNEFVLKRGGKKAVKKKRSSGGDRGAKVASKRDVSIKGDGTSSNKPDQEKVEKLVAKAKSHAQAVQAVKRAVFDIQLFLLEGVKTESQLQSSGALLTQVEYQDVVVERSIDKKCGYPLCHKPLVPDVQRKGRFRISVSDHKIYDTRETGLYCSQGCFMTSKTFALSLEIERDGLVQQEKLSALVRSVRDCKAPSAGSRKAAPSSTDEAVDSLLAEVKERQDAETAGFEDAGPSDAIEGYIPFNSIRDWRLRKEAQQQSNASNGGNLANPNVDGKASPVETAFISGPSPEKGKSTLMQGPGNIAGSLQHVPMPKSILKTSQAESTVKRRVSWGDQKLRGDQIQKVESKVKLKTASKPRRQTKEMPQPLKSAMAATSSATKSRALSASSSACQIEVAESPGDSAEAKAAIFRGIEGLSLTEKHPSSIKETGYDFGEPAHADCESAQGSPLGENVTGSNVSCNSQVTRRKGKCDATKPVTDTEAHIAERLASAKDVAAALTEAAEATATGDFDSSEAVARVGLSFLSVDETSQDLVSATSLTESSVELGEAARVGLKWPQIEPQEEYDEEVQCSKAGWHDTAPKSFKLEISKFGAIWIALEEWISAATIAFIYGKEAQYEDDFLSINGREYRLQVICEDGVSAEISRALSNCIARALPDVVQALGLRTPLSTLEQSLGRMVRTMSFVEPLPAIGVNHWRMLVILLLEGLSVDQVRSIGVDLSKNSSLFHKLLISTGTSEVEYSTLRSLLLPSGRLPSVSTLSGD